MGNLVSKKKKPEEKIPLEIVLDHILPCFEYRWLATRGRLVCKYWNEIHQRIEPLNFPIKFQENGEPRILKMPLELRNKVTRLECYTKTEYLELTTKNHIRFVSKLVNLKEVYFNQSFGAIVDEVCKLKLLQKVEFFNIHPSLLSKFMKLGQPNLKSFTISKSEKISYNNLTFNGEWPLETLSVTRLDRNSYISILNSKFALETLTRLKIVCSQKFSDSSFLSAFQNLKCLTELDCDTSQFEEGFPYLFKLGKLQKLKSLYSNPACYHDISSLTILEELHFHKNMQEYDIIGKIRNLTSLELKTCGLGDEGAEYLSSLTNLVSLNIPNNLIGSEGVKNFEKLHLLRKLGLSNNNIGNGLKYLGKCRSLTDLDVETNSVSQLALFEFCQVSCCTNLKYLNISLNSIQDGFGYLGCLDLTLISAKSCAITETGIIEFLKQCSIRNYDYPPIRYISLYLPRNTVTERALKEILNFNSEHCKIWKLELSHQYDIGNQIIKQLKRRFELTYKTN